MNTSDLIRETLRIVPDLDDMHERLTRDASEVISSPIAERSQRDAIHRHRNEARAIIGEPGDVINEELTRAEDHLIERARRGAKSAVEKVQKHGQDANLDSDDILGLEAIVVWDGRPAILIQDGHFLPPPDRWKRLEDTRADIEATFQSVGRVDLEGHPSLDWVGTAFMAGTDVALTNRHVVKEFASPQADRWRIEPDISATVDFADLFGSSKEIQYDVEAVEAVHPSLDLAILRLKPRSNRKTPPALPIAPASFRVQPKQLVYLVGYPAPDFRRENDPGLVQRIFNGIFGVKRLQPGLVLGRQPSKTSLSHDCSTLNGNSGSCVIDLATHQVIGLHYRGLFLEANFAVALEQLGGDKVLTDAGIAVGR